ncbi:MULTISPECIES: hypothetical protein [Bradyrhizobium]|uniref:Uncharacterized protein n=1 Tax=Bradyrhizobium elkanii TaxID=29448 RepID=A0A4V6CYK9_BRAEL|nr:MULTISPECIES: hypothetical protein [Bradyrhizobium]MTV15029.1 hypothetical protein [Bradyrhizobium sp. BR2003]TKV79365.1 hypothetical protein FDV58_22305 [Bradyrhizobium elkanii]
MIWKTFVNRLAIASRRRGLATAFVYGLSLAVRFTSAAGEEVEIPVQSVQRTYPAISIMSTAQPIVLRQGWSLKSPMSARSSPECLTP